MDKTRRNGNTGGRVMAAKVERKTAILWFTASTANERSIRLAKKPDFSGKTLFRVRGVNHVK
jgi:hypothetical protein